ncbi:MAG TPA: RecX family transcriptional regulator [Capsulimonadaceae bacterium]|jgi:regulatory protein
MPAISAIEPQRRKGRFNIFVDGDFVIGVGEKVIADLGLRTGKEITAERLNEIAVAEERRRAMDNAARLLEIRQRSAREIRDRLKQKGYEGNVIDDVEATLKRLGLIDDAQFATAWVESRSRSRPSGARKLRNELAAKGVARDEVDDAVAGVTGDHEAELALAALSKKVRSLPEDRAARLTERTRLAGYLQRRGFAWPAVKVALESVFDVVDEDA